ncbi:MAG TPA: oxidoreductase, partial [Methylophaga aminisulfidivorans]|nr:oxidoreductase [Methylophaga aminisulfidivorans]
MSALKIKVTAVEEVAEHIKHFSFAAVDGKPLPYFSGGSHVVVSMDINGRTHRNAYSLMGPTSDNSQYQIAVRKQEKSRGGSVFVHENVTPGTELEISMPTNLFAIHRLAKKHILVAGGIGITPFLSQITDLNRIGHNYELHYAYRSAEHGAFREQIEALCGDKAFFYPENETGRLNITELLSHQPLGSHVYVCGPDPMVNGLELIAKQLGWPSTAVHS